MIFFTATRTPYHHQHDNVKTPSPTLRCHHHTKISQRNYITSTTFWLNTSSCPLHTWTQNISDTITLARQTRSIYASVNRTWSIRLFQCVHKNASNTSDPSQYKQKTNLWRYDGITRRISTYDRAAYEITTQTATNVHYRCPLATAVHLSSAGSDNGLCVCLPPPSQPAARRKLATEPQNTIKHCTVWTLKRI